MKHWTFDIFFFLGNNRHRLRLPLQEKCHSPFNKCFNTTSVNVHVPEPSCGCSNYDSKDIHIWKRPERQQDTWKWLSTRVCFLIPGESKHRLISPKGRTQTTMFPEPLAIIVIPNMSFPTITTELSHRKTDPVFIRDSWQFWKAKTNGIYVLVCQTRKHLNGINKWCIFSINVGALLTSTHWQTHSIKTVPITCLIWYQPVCTARSRSIWTMTASVVLHLYTNPLDLKWNIQGAIEEYTFRCFTKDMAFTFQELQPFNTD